MCSVERDVVQQIDIEQCKDHFILQSNNHRMRLRYMKMMSVVCLTVCINKQRERPSVCLFVCVRVRAHECFMRLSDQDQGRTTRTKSWLRHCV